MNEKNKMLRSGVMLYISLIILLAAAIFSLGMMLRAGGNNNSVVLVSLFVGWVLSPFIALLIAFKLVKFQAVQGRSSLYFFTLLLSLISFVGYSGVLVPPDTKPAFIFLAIPLLSWVLIGIFFLIIQLRRKRKAV